MFISSSILFALIYKISFEDNVITLYDSDGDRFSLLHSPDGILPRRDEPIPDQQAYNVVPGGY
jgi:hypothetical protein